MQKRYKGMRCFFLFVTVCYERYLAKSHACLQATLNTASVLFSYLFFKEIYKHKNRALKFPTPRMEFI